MGVAPSVPRDPTRKVEVIGAGLSRTGTSTFAIVMERLLNGPVHHGGSQLIGREDAYLRKCHDLFVHKHDRQRTLKNLRDLTAGFVAVCDAPLNGFIPELCELYPDAKVICVERDKEKWWNSMKPVVDTGTARWLFVLLWPVPGWRWIPYVGRDIISRFKDVYGFDLSPDTYDANTEYLKAVVPKGRLHFVSLKGGWKPFCKILDRPVPDEPLPHVNDASSTDKLAMGMILRAGTLWLMILAVFGLVGYGSWTHYHG